MNSENIAVFIGESGKGIENLYSNLRTSYIHCNIKDYFGNKIITVNNEIDYYNALVVGNVLAHAFEFNVKKVDRNGEAGKIDDFCICRIHASYLNKDDTIFTVENIVQKLSEIIQIPISYKCDRDIYEIHISLLEAFKDTSISRLSKNTILGIVKYTLDDIKSFFDTYLLKEKNNGHFSSIYSVDVIDFDGSIIYTKYQKELQELENVKSYYKLSSLHLGLYYPEGRSLSPKVFEKDYSKQICHYAYNTNDLFADNYLKKTEKEIEGRKKYNVHYEESYYDSNPQTTDNFFEMDNIVEVSYKIDILNDNKLRVISEVKVKRHTKGNKICNSKTLYDDLFKNTEYKDCEFSFTCTDYYEIIDLNLLLHYTDSSKYYETFKIPIGFRFEDGLFDIKNTSVIYDNVNNKWSYYDDISEVKNALTK